MLYGPFFSFLFLKTLENIVGTLFHFMNVSYLIVILNNKLQFMCRRLKPGMWQKFKGGEYFLSQATE